MVLSSIGLLYIAVSLGLGTLLIAHSYKITVAPIERRRLTWLVGGMAVGLFPFVAVYVPLYVFGVRHALSLPDVHCLSFRFRSRIILEPTRQFGLCDLSSGERSDHPCRFSLSRRETHPVAS